MDYFLQPLACGNWTPFLIQSESEWGSLSLQVAAVVLKKPVGFKLDLSTGKSVANKRCLNASSGGGASGRVAGLCLGRPGLNPGKD